MYLVLQTLKVGKNAEITRYDTFKPVYGLYNSNKMYTSGRSLLP